MGRTTDLTGQTFGRLHVLEKAGYINSRVYWYCECSCGTWVLALTHSLKSGNTKSCGCLKKEKHSKLMTKHGMGSPTNRTAEYRAWMRYKNELPEEWHDFVRFFCDVGERPSTEARLSRRDMQQPHGPNNTYWRDIYAERQQLAELDYRDEFCFDFDAILRTGASAKAGTQST